MNFHGGNIYEYTYRILDYSSNINPFGVPSSFKKALIDRLDDFTKYPDIEYKELRNNIAKYLNISSFENIIVGNGAVEIIYKYLSMIFSTGYTRMICLAPTFSEYARAGKMCNMEIVELRAFSKDYKRVDLDMIVDTSDSKTVVVLCNPNNPTGTLVTKEQLEYLASSLDNKGSKLLIDEAFIEFTVEYPDTSMLDLIEKYKNIFLVRAVTKFFGMPGIRLGYGISGSSKLIKNLRELLEPWNINTSAVIAGETVFRDKEYINKTRQWLSEEYSYLYTSLNNIKGIKSYKSNVNFHLVEIDNKSINAWILKDLMIKNGVLIRTPDGFNGLNEYYFRLAVKDRESNSTMLKVLKEVMEK